MSSIKHVRLTERGGTYDQGTAYCGYSLAPFDFALVDVEHARASIEKGSFTQPCKKCWKAILKLVEKQEAETA